MTLPYKHNESSRNREIINMITITYKGNNLTYEFSTANKTLETFSFVCGGVRARVRDACI